MTQKARPTCKTACWCRAQFLLCFWPWFFRCSSFVVYRIAVKFYIFLLIFYYYYYYIFSIRCFVTSHDWKFISEYFKRTNQLVWFICVVLLSCTPQSQKWRGKSVISTWMMRTCVIMCWPAAWLKRSAAVRWEPAGGTTVRSIPAPYREQVLGYITH